MPILGVPWGSSFGELGGDIGEHIVAILSVVSRGDRSVRRVIIIITVMY